MPLARHLDAPFREDLVQTIALALDWSEGVTSIPLPPPVQGVLPAPTVNERTALDAAGAKVLWTRGDEHGLKAPGLDGLPGPTTARTTPAMARAAWLLQNPSYMPPIAINTPKATASTSHGAAPGGPLNPIPA